MRGWGPRPAVYKGGGNSETESCFSFGRRRGSAGSVGICFVSGSRFRLFFLFDLLAAMTTSRRLADRKVQKFEKNVTKRGAVPETSKKGKDYPVGPILLGFFVFVVIGSSLFQIIRTATSGGMA